LVFFILDYYNLEYIFVNVSTIILAAGSGTRMKSDLPKFLHAVSGRPLVEWSLQASATVSGERPIVVVGHGRQQVQELLQERVEYAVQEEQLGTGHAVQQAEPLLRSREGAVIVIYSDMPLLRGETLRDLIEIFEDESKSGDLGIAMLTIHREDPQGFGRIVRHEDGQIAAIVEEVDCTPEQLKIQELNPGIYCFDSEWLWDNLSKMPLSAKGEYYLTDMISIAVSQGKRVVSTTVAAEDVNGINTRLQLSQAEAVMRQRILDSLMLSGVTIMDPASTYIEDTVSIAQDTTILPGCLLQGDTKIGGHSVIGPNTRVVNSTVGAHSEISYSVIEQASVGDYCDVGPFAHLRKGAVLDTGVHMGNFGEVKNSYLGPGTKMGHFSYIGDTQIDDNVNIGAGTITCNYDGKNKSQTKIGENAFIGSGTMLVAPVTIGENAQTGAGSVVTKDVPADTVVYGVPARQPKKE